MSRRKVFFFFRFIHRALGKSIAPVFGNKFRYNYVLFSYRLKVFLFPEYGSQVPSEDEISPISKGLSWGVPAIPNWVLDEMKDLARDIDPILYPTDQFLIKCQYYSFPVLPDPGKVYRNLMQNCSSDHYTHCFAIPWLKRGGADLVILKHVELSACIPGGKVLIIITEPGESPWLSRIPAGVDVIDARLMRGDQQLPRAGLVDALNGNAAKPKAGDL